MLGEPAIICLKEIEYTTTHPYTRNHRGEWVQKPYIVIKGRYKTYTLLGKKVMWSYFDALFSNNPLPRQGVNDDIFSPETDSPSLYALLNDFTKESIAEGTEYLIAYHVEGDITYVEPFNQGIVTDIEMMYHYLKSEGLTPEKKPFLYRGKTQSIRPCVSFDYNGWEIQFVDIGTRWYIRGEGFGSTGRRIGLITPESILKSKKNDVANAFKRALGYADSAKPSSMDWPITAPRLPSGLKTHEQDRLLVNRRLSI